MRVAVITHSSVYQIRAEAVASFFKKRGDTVLLVCADFDHMAHRKRSENRPDHVYLSMRPYQNNLSAKRLFSLRQFGLDAGKYLEAEMEKSGAFDLLYFLIPLNTFCAEAERLKNRFHSKIIFDIVDLWPESLPFDHFQKLPPIWYWKNLRDSHLGCADRIFTECRLYQETCHFPAEKTETLYWFRDKPDKVYASGENRDDDTLRIAYVGSINYLIDLQMIGELLGALCRLGKVELHIIGAGANAENFVRTASAQGCRTYYYGAVYDEKRKQEILAPCVYGLNIMKPQVKVGLTMKSLEYLVHGIPIINTIPGDTWEMVEKEGIGINVQAGQIEEAAARIMAGKQGRNRADKVRECYERHFTRAAFESTLAAAVEKL